MRLFFLSETFRQQNCSLQILLPCIALLLCSAALAEDAKKTVPAQEAGAASALKTEAVSKTPAQKAEVVSLERQLAELQQQKKKDASYSADFSTRLFIARTKKERVSKGKVKYHPPTKFRWEVTQPESELYVATGSELWKYNAKAKHAQKMPMNAAGLEFLQVLLDPVELAKRYEITEWPRSKETGASGGAEKNATAEKSSELFDRMPAVSGDSLFVKLIPKVKTGTEDYLYILADKGSGQVREIRIAFKDGNRNTIAFEKWQQELVSELTFKFEPPPGTAVDKM